MSTEFKFVLIGGSTNNWLGRSPKDGTLTTSEFGDANSRCAWKSLT